MKHIAFFIAGFLVLVGLLAIQAHAGVQLSHLPDTFNVQATSPINQQPYVWSLTRQVDGSFAGGVSDGVSYSQIQPAWPAFEIQWNDPSGDTALTQYWDIGPQPDGSWDLTGSQISSSDPAWGVYGNSGGSGSSVPEPFFSLPLSLALCLLRRPSLQRRWPLPSQL